MTKKDWRSEKRIDDPIIHGERDSQQLAEMSRGLLRNEIPELQQALQGLGASGRAMLEAIIHGEQNSQQLAEMSRGLLRNKIPELQ